MASGLFETLSFGPAGWGDELLAGVTLTLELALTALPIGFGIGLGVALAKDSRSRLLRGFGELYTTVFRGLPELLTIFLVYYGAPRLANAAAGAAGSLIGVEAGGFGGEANGFFAGVVALALVTGAYSSEVFLAAMRGVPIGQREAAKSLGLGRWATFQLVLLPQIWRIALPGLTNNWLVLLKDTSLVSVIALAELMRQANLAAIATRQHFLFYLVACLIYLALSGLSTAIARRLEAKAGRGFARARR